MEIRDFCLKSARKVYRSLAKPEFKLPDCEKDRQRANDKIYNLLSADAPCMISRFGSGEIGVVTNYLTVHSADSMLVRCRDYVTGNTGLPWWDKLFFRSLRLNMGVFPESVEMMERFAERYLQDTPLIDLLGSFNYTEKYMPLRPDVVNVHLECLYPFFVERPWTRALKGKKVLVVHPFVESIASQYQRREKLFENPDVCPSYELKLLRAVQSNAGGEVAYSDWFEALRWMEEEITKTDFDFCILGCGAYGLPLAAHVKRLGKKAIHIGGVHSCFGASGASVGMTRTMAIAG